MAPFRLREHNKVKDAQLTLFKTGDRPATKENMFKNTHKQKTIIKTYVIKLAAVCLKKTNS